MWIDEWLSKSICQQYCDFSREWNVVHLEIFSTQNITLWSFPSEEKYIDVYFHQIRLSRVRGENFYAGKLKFVKQGKKVCKATAARCLFVFVAEKRYSKTVTTTRSSYIGQLLTAAGRCKNEYLIIILMDPQSTERIFSTCLILAFTM